MIKSKRCPKCDNTQIAGPHNIHGDRHVKIDLPGMYTATLVAYTCTECGYTELYSDKMGLDNIRRDGRFVLNPGRVSPSTCPTCGVKIRTGSKMCHECGYSIE